MHWSDEAILLSVKKHGEHQAVVRLFARQHGVYASIARGAYSKKQRGVYQPGNIVTVNWNARLSEHMGSIAAEMQEPVTAFILDDAMKLAALSAAASLMEMILPERHPYPILYRQFHELLMHLKYSDKWQEDYVRFELGLLAESGFGLDLKACAATGQSDNLSYVSPKSGRAVSETAGEPYKDKLLPLPAFLLTSPERGEVAEHSDAGGGITPRINKYNSHSLIPNARELRTNMPEAEKRLWYRLRAHRLNGYGFRRQHPLSEHYIADFICLDKKLVIELDGGQHSQQQEYDHKRTGFLEKEGYRVLRFWNNEIFENIKGVLEIILQVLQNENHPLPNPPPVRGRENMQETLAGLRLSGYFLDSWLAKPHGRQLPVVRDRLVQMIERTHGKTKG